MKARKCIIKAGSLDNYLLNTKPADIDSKFGLYLRELIQKKGARVVCVRLSVVSVRLSGHNHL